MTFPETTPPSTDTEPASQYCKDDPFGLGDIPDFLRRTPGKAKRRQRPRKVWRVTPAMKAAAQKDQTQREKIAARPMVLRAIEDSADTFGKIRKATGLSDPWIQSALRRTKLLMGNLPCAAVFSRPEPPPPGARHAAWL